MQHPGSAAQPAKRTGTSAPVAKASGALTSKTSADSPSSPAALLETALVDIMKAVEALSGHVKGNEAQVIQCSYAYALVCRPWMTPGRFHTLTPTLSVLVCAFDEAATHNAAIMQGVSCCRVFYCSYSPNIDVVVQGLLNGEFN
jgi:hypothetical protein